MSTVKLYDANAYDTEFCAQVLSCEVKKTERGTVYQVILDRTLFFPEEGGQSPDRGILERVFPESGLRGREGRAGQEGLPVQQGPGGENRTARVLDVQLCRENEEEIIVHTLDEPFAPGETVRGKIDWEHRFSNMQQHTGEHIFSGIVNRRYGWNNVGFHLSDSIVTMDYDGALTPEQIAETEWEANRAIAANLLVEVSFPSKEEEQKLTYRSKIEVQGQLRIVTIPGYDVCACCAPHVKRTGEIGLLKVMQAQNYKGGVRLSILCGFRALAAFREKADTVADLTHFFSCSQEKLGEQARRLRSREQELEAEISALRQERLLARLEGIPAEQEHVFLFSSETDPLIIRRGVNFLAERHDGICGIFFAEGAEERRDVPADHGKSEEKEFRFIIGSRREDCRAAAELLKKELGAKGGGKPEMVQGSVRALAEEIEKALSQSTFSCVRI